MPTPILTTRRDFLRSTVLGGAMAWTVPSFVAQTFSALHAAADGSMTQVATGKDSPILILIQLAGGNDGLNAVIPYTNDYYYKARPTLAIPGQQVLKINDSLGFNPVMTGFKSLYDAGHLSVVNGVGYPNPDRSHFRSTEIWQTACDADAYLREGWLGRYFDNACTGCDAATAISIGDRAPQSFTSKTGAIGISFNSPDTFRFVDARNGTDEETTYRNMTSVPDTAAGGSIEMVSGTQTLSNAQSALDFLERTAMNAEVSSDLIRSVAAKTKNLATYPNSGLAGQLKLVARLIGGGMTTRVYYVSHGGFDTHSGQRTAHDSKLAELASSVKAFTDDLIAMNQFDRVRIMTFSEFGRRVAENASRGTDHGAAAPLFVIGGKVGQGVVGAEPSLAPADLVDGDIKYNTDFRSVYATLLENWMKTPSTPILGKAFDKLPLIA
jgi:uncharacterized protein (DUF1501 family)